MASSNGVMEESTKESGARASNTESEFIGMVEEKKRRELGLTEEEPDGSEYVLYFKLNHLYRSFSKASAN